MEMSQNPAFGLLGWYHNFLVIGLPLLFAISPEHFRAIVAHELGHLSKIHGWFSYWIDRSLITWLNLIETLQKEEQLIPLLVFGLFTDGMSPASLP